MAAADDDVRLVAVSLDCADPAILADFYAALLGGTVVWQNEQSAGVRVPGGVLLVAQRAADYAPSPWPGPGLVHLDLSAGTALEVSETRAVELGAVRAEPQPDDRWRVLRDPAGHPFCLTTVTPPAETSPRLTPQDELDSALANTDRTEVEALTEQLRRPAGRLFFTGRGRSGLVAQLAAMRFMQLGRTCHVVGDATAPAIGAGDTLLVVSGSGRTPVSVAFAEIARREGAHVFLVTHEDSSPLRELADVAVVVPVIGSVQFGGTLFEQSALILLDSIVLELMRDLDDPSALMERRHSNLQ